MVREVCVDGTLFSASLCANLGVFRNECGQHIVVLAILVGRMLKDQARALLAEVDFPGFHFLLRRVSGRLPLRQKRCLASPTWAREEVQSWRTIAPALDVEWDAARYCGGVPDYRIALPRRYPAWGLLEASRLVVMGPDGWILDRQGRWLSDHSWFAWAPEKAPRREFTPPVRRIKGHAVLLCSDWAATNYFHFLLDSLSRLAALEALGISSQVVDHYLIPESPAPAAALLLDQLEIPRDKRIVLNPSQALEADCLLAPSFPGETCATHPLAVGFLQRSAQRMRSVDEQFPRRLFVARRAKNRLLANEKAVWGLLEPLGFTFYDPGSASSQMQCFAAAEAVVGVHGAALANVAFCSPGTPVVEIMPSDHAFPYFQAICSAAGLRYYCVLAQSSAMRPMDDLQASPYDFEVDLGHLREALEAAGLR
ncbi:glycosyltransferase 61 family protein [Nostoc sp. NIES-2111]